MSRSEQAEPAGKAAKIIEAARDAFFEHGYEAVSMDEVAKRAGVAKQTVYSYYPSKDALFLAVHADQRDRVDAALEPLPITSPEDARAALEDLGVRLLKLLLSPSMRALFRVTVSAAHRFPSLGKEIYSGIRQRQEQITEILRRAMAAGTLRAGDPELAAEHYIALVRGELFFHCIVDPGFNPSQAAVARQVEQAVDSFLAKYGAAASGSP